MIGSVNGEVVCIDEHFLSNQIQNRSKLNCFLNKIVNLSAMQSLRAVKNDSAQIGDDSCSQMDQRAINRGGGVLNGGKRN